MDRILYPLRTAKLAGAHGAAWPLSFSAQKRGNLLSKGSWFLRCSWVLNILQQSWVQQFSALAACLQEGSSPLVLSDKVSLSCSVPVFEPAGDSKTKPETSPVYLPTLWCQHWSPDNDQDLPKLSCGVYQQLQKQFSSEWLLRPFICRDNQVKLWDQLHSAEEPSAQKKGWSSSKGELPFLATSAFVYQGCVV